MIQDQLAVLVGQASLPAPVRLVAMAYVKTLSDEQCNRLVELVREAIELCRQGDVEGLEAFCVTLGVPVEFAGLLWRMFTHDSH